MSKILKFIIKNMESHNYKEVFEIIEDLLINKQITLDTMIKRNEDQNEISLKDFVFEFYKENSFDFNLDNFMDKYNISVSPKSNEESYLFLIKFLEKCFIVSSREEIESNWKIFKEKESSSEGVVTYLNNSDLNNADYLFKLIFKNSSSNIGFVFKEVIEDYLGFNNVENVFKKYISNKAKFFSDIDGVINLLNENSYLMNFKNRREKTILEDVFLSLLTEF